MRSGPSGCDDCDAWVAEQRAAAAPQTSKWCPLCDHYVYFTPNFAAELAASVKFQEENPDCLVSHPREYTRSSRVPSDDLRKVINSLLKSGTVVTPRTKHRGGGADTAAQLRGILGGGEAQVISGLVSSDFVNPRIKYGVNCTPVSITTFRPVVPLLGPDMTTPLGWVLLSKTPEGVACRGLARGTYAGMGFSANGLLASDEVPGFDAPGPATGYTITNVSVHPLGAVWSEDYRVVEEGTPADVDDLFSALGRAMDAQ